MVFRHLAQECCCETPPLAPGRITVVVIQGEFVSRQASGHTQNPCAPGLSLVPSRSREDNSSSLFLFFTALAGLFLAVALSAPQLNAQQRREREPNVIYAGRRAQLSAQADGPIILWGFTGREEVSQANVFAQEENFYYLTGHNEEGAGLIIFPAHKHNTPPPTVGAPPAATHDDALAGSREIFFLPIKDPAKEKW